MGEAIKEKKEIEEKISCFENNARHTFLKDFFTDESILGLATEEDKAAKGLKDATHELQEACKEAELSIEIKEYSKLENKVETQIKKLKEDKQKIEDEIKQRK